MRQIKNRFTGEVIYKTRGDLVKLIEKNKMNLAGADLSCMDLHKIDLTGANLVGANLNRTNLVGVDAYKAKFIGATLYKAKLNRADLFKADFTGANLTEAKLIRANLANTKFIGADLTETIFIRTDLLETDFTGANLTNANLSGSNLTRADLTRSDLTRADLTRTNLFEAVLTRANIEFPQIPSIGLLSVINLENLPDDITLELMRRDADVHPYPDKFDVWAKGGDCPYTDNDGNINSNGERKWIFEVEEKRHLWKPGKPTMTDEELITAICKAEGWKIKNIRLKKRN